MQRVAAGGLRDWAPRAFGDFARIRPLHAIGTRGYPWTEIDFPEDYRARGPRRPAGDRRRGLSRHRRPPPDSTTTVIENPTPPSSSVASGAPEIGAIAAVAGVGRVTESHMYERFYRLRERPFALTPDPDYLYPSRVHQEALELPALRHREPRRLHRHHRRDRIGQDDAAADAAARPRQPDDGRARDEHDARSARAARVGDDRLRARSRRAKSKPAMLRDLRRVPGRTARCRAAGAAGDRRGAEPDAAGARRDPDAVESRDREVEAAADRPGRPAGPARQARSARSSSSCGSASPSAIT